MDKIKQAAIVMLGMGERYAGDILKGMDPKEVEAIIEAINHLDNVTEVEIIQALNSFFKDTNNNSGIDIVTKEIFKHSLASVVESKKIETMLEGDNADRVKWLDVFKLQSSEMIYSIVQDEHPQVIAVIAAMILPGEKASHLIKRLSKEVKGQVIARMASISPVSTFGMESFAAFFEKELHNKDKYSEISVNGVEAVANIISYLDSENERDIFDGISSINSGLSEIIQEKIMPFEKLTQLDKKSLQTLLSEVSNDDLVLALKGSESYVKNVFLKNMASKSADILKDELESKGPVRIANVIDAQKRIVNLAKKLADEDKIIISTKVDSDVVY
jgi:flagellar motor switch protein FliG